MWSLFCVDLQKEQDSNAHISGWILLIYKYWKGYWYWNCNWKYRIFLNVTWGGGQHSASQVTLRSPGPVWNHVSRLPKYLWPGNVAEWSLTVEKIHLQYHLTFRSHGQVRNVNSYICISTTPIATKLCKVVIYCQKTTPTKSCDVLIKWSRDKCKALYLFFRNTCSHQTQQSSNLSWRELNFKAMWPFVCGVTWYMKKTCICTSTIPITIKLGRVVTYSGKTPPTNLRDFSITWSRGKCKLLYLDVGNTYDLQTCQSGNLQWRNPKFKVTWTFDHVTRDKWKKLYLHLHYIYDHQTWKSGNLRLEAPSIWSRDLLITQAHGKWKKKTYIGIFNITFDQVVTCMVIICQMFLKYLLLFSW